MSAVKFAQDKRIRVTDDFVFFWGSVLSQWYKVPFTIGKISFNCAEQAMMLFKADLFKDVNAVREVMLADEPEDQKAWGRKVKNFDKEVWERWCQQEVYRINYFKFIQNPELLQYLLDTGDRQIVEASPKDTIWGIGLGREDDRCLDPREWLGTNWLGNALTNLRNDFRSGHFRHEPFKNFTNAYRLI